MRPGYLLRAAMHFREKDASYFAGGIAFYLLFALTPFLLLTLSIAALFAGSQGAFVEVFDSFFKANVPAYARTIHDTLYQVFEHRGRIGLVGLFWLFLAARKLVNAIEIGLNAVLEVEKPKSGILSTLASMAFIFLAALLFLATVLFTVALDFALGIDVSFVPDKARSLAETILSAVVSGLASVALFYGIYRLAPARGLSNRDALFASVAACFMWLGARHAFVWFGARQMANYQWLYGSMAGFLMIMLWAYVFGNALLMGACLVKKK